MNQFNFTDLCQLLLIDIHNNIVTNRQLSDRSVTNINDRLTGVGMIIENERTSDELLYRSRILSEWLIHLSRHDGRPNLKKFITTRIQEFIIIMNRRAFELRMNLYNANLTQNLDRIEESVMNNAELRQELNNARKTIEELIATVNEQRIDFR